MSPQKHFLLGVTGSIATGKSTVAGLLADRGALTIDFDILARKAVEPEMPAWKDIVEYFGKGVLNQDNSLNRQALSDIVFKNAASRKQLEHFTHPRISELYFKQLKAYEKNESKGIVQAVVPLLFETDMHSLFHKTLLVYAPKSIQLKRLMERESIDEIEANARISSQMPIDDKLALADYIVRNDQSLDETEKQVAELWQKLTMEFLN